MDDLNNMKDVVMIDIDGNNEYVVKITETEEVLYYISLADTPRLALNYVLRCVFEAHNTNEDIINIFKKIEIDNKPLLTYLIDENCIKVKKLNKEAVQDILNQAVTEAEEVEFEDNILNQTAKAEEVEFEDDENIDDILTEASHNAETVEYDENSIIKHVDGKMVILDTKERRLVLQREKELFTKNGEPWVAVIHMNIDPKNIRKGTFELDWNDKFLAELVKAGYKGDNEAAIFEQWFNEICKNIYHSTFEQMQANRTKPTDLGNGFLSYE